jgi:hypothetical protein
MTGALKELFRSTEVPLDIKYKMYATIPLNTSLWGCESWAMTEADKKPLEVFHHKAILQVLGITMKRVREERISNAEIRKRFTSITKITNFVTRHTLRYIGKMIQNENDFGLEKIYDCAATHHDTKVDSSEPTKTFSSSTYKRLCLLRPQMPP